MEEPTPLVRPARRVMLGQEVADRLREAILTGALEPGTHLVEERMATQLGVSRGPVREAFARLEQEGLVTLLPHRGGVVKSLTSEDVEEVYTLRLALETLAVSLAATRAGEADIARARQVIDRFSEALQSTIDAQAAAEFDLEFHDAVYQIASHGRLLAAWTSIRSQVFLLLLTRNLADPDWRERMVNGHLAILDRIQAHDVPAAIVLLQDHLLASYELIRSKRGFGGEGSSFLDALTRFRPAGS